MYPLGAGIVESDWRYYNDLASSVSTSVWTNVLPFSFSNQRLPNGCDPCRSRAEADILSQLLRSYVIAAIGRPTHF